ncbi:MAG: acetate/propionate family kinase [Eubacterium sp.]|uniref:acetate/propionate family kinase n=1 Tax=Eubacterium sp. TaxID=142586 RepID=UPI003A137FD3
MKILVINCGSSSLKFQLIDMSDESVICKGTIERIGLPIQGGENNIIYRVGDKSLIFDKENKTHTDAFNTVIDLMMNSEYKVLDSLDEINAIGHRVVQGGEKYTKSVLFDSTVAKDIEDLAPLAPLHNPANLQGYKACVELFGKKIPQVAVFDTAFHSTMPPMAYMYALPYEYFEKYGIRRYGFHGTSHKYVSQRCADLMGVDIERIKMITCHLGNGSSIAAIKFGKVFDTSMGFTPLDGFMMGTRSGGIDPSVVTYLQQKLDLSPQEIEDILNKQSGVSAISGGYSDDRDIMAKQNDGDERAILAHEMQAYQIAKYIGSYVAAMNGVDAIVFTGGIGENGFWLRSKVCSYLGFLGVNINQSINQKAVKGKEAELSLLNDKVRVFVLATNEELMIARDTKEIVENLK